MLHRHTDIRYIGVAQESGALVGEGDIPAYTLAGWRAWQNKTNADAYWYTGDSQTFQIGFPYVNNFNVKAGAVLIVYDKSAIERATGDMARKLGQDVLLTTSLLVALTLGGVYALTHKFSRQLASIGNTIDGALDAAAPAKLEVHVLNGDVAQDINDFAALSHAVVRDLVELERALGLPEHESGGRT